MRIEDRPTHLQQQLRRLARLCVTVFYGRFEVQGLEHIPARGPVLLCANHANAIIDGVIMLAAYPGLLRPLARSGLFNAPLLGAMLRAQGAVPVYRREDVDSHGGNPSVNNEAAFSRCYEMFASGASLLIFPEGQSHSDPHLHEFKTGAARLVLGAEHANGRAPQVIPVGLTFTRKGRFRGDVLVQFGEPVSFAEQDINAEQDQVRAYTEAIETGAARVTLNSDSWDSLNFARQIERFIAVRRGRYRRRTLAQRFLALQRLMQIQQLIAEREPRRLEILHERLEGFSNLCDRFGVRDYHLTVRYSPGVMAAFMLRGMVMLCLVVPLALWGWLNSAMPFYATRYLAPLLSANPDQYDSAKLGLGALLFGSLWLAQSLVVGWWLGPGWAMAYAVSLPVSAALALFMVRERRRLRENLRAFWSLLGKGDLRRLLEQRRAELEQDLASLARIFRRQCDTRGRQAGDS